MIEPKDDRHIACFADAAGRQAVVVLRRLAGHAILRDEECTRLLLPFEELPVLYDEDEFPLIDDGFFD